MSLSREAKIYLALWRKTANEPNGFEVKFPNYSLAISARQGLYRAIKPFRNRPDLDPILATAADLFVVSINAEQFKLHFTPRKTLEALENQLNSLGISEDDLLDPAELAVKQSLDRLLSGIDEPSGPTVSTPFYQR